MTETELEQILDGGSKSNPLGADVTIGALVREVKRLRALVFKAEFAATDNAECAYCPWCGHPEDAPIRPCHYPDCPAFSAPGVVR